MKELAYCGIVCDECDYREKCSCPTCHEAKGKMFWGQCSVAKCNIEKKHKNCSECSEFPCELLNSFAYDKEQGDNGQRIENLKNYML